MENVIDMYKCTGTGYERGWWTNCKCRYRIYKGARNTKKSYDMIGYEVIDKIISDPRRNVMIIRNTFTSHKGSTFTTLCRIIQQPIIDEPDVTLTPFFKINQQELTITYKPTGQVIWFRGFDDPAKIASVRTITGYLTDVYVEEAFEIKDYDAWRIADGSFRGNKFFPKDLFIQITFCFNAWSKNHWLYEKFFKGRMEDDLQYLLTHPYQDWCDPNLIIEKGRGLYLHTSTYKINEFRDTEEYDIAMEEMRKKVPEIYKVEALGMWGNASATTYPEMNDDLITTPSKCMTERYACYTLGIDTGLSNGEGKIKLGKDVRLRSATTLQMVGISMDYERLYSIDEFFYSNEQELIKKTEPQLVSEIIDKIIDWKYKYSIHPDLMKGTIVCYVDSADIGFRQGLELEARKKNLFNIVFEKSTKLPIQSRVDFQRILMGYGDYLISNNCENLIRELRNSRHGDRGEVREDFDDHALTAMEYASAAIINKLKKWKDFKMR